MHRVRQKLDIEFLFVMSFALLGLRVGADPISDNSLLTHLRTGLRIISDGGIPRGDPYSYTAPGSDWVVQSWLPEWTYGWLFKLGGPEWIVVQTAVLLALLAGGTAWLARTGNARRTCLTGLIVTMIAAPGWSARPLVFGLLCFLALVLVVDRQRSPWWVVPIALIWVHSHGSFPVGLVWLGLVLVGTLIDRRGYLDLKLVRTIGAYLLGLLLAALWPLGPKILTFPLVLSSRSDVFSNIIEWQAPRYDNFGQKLQLLGILAAVLVLLRCRRPWAELLPVVVFIGMALYSVRNFTLVAIVVAPVLGNALRSRPSLEISRNDRRSLEPLLFGVIVLAGAFFLAGAARGPGLSLAAYPERAVSFLEESDRIGGDRRLAHQDFVGNYLHYRFNGRVKVFVDDRVDMYPRRVLSDYLTLLRGDPGALAILERRQIDTVLWEKSLPLVELLAQSERWKQVYRRGAWVVFERSRAGS